MMASPPESLDQTNLLAGAGLEQAYGELLWRGYCFGAVNTCDQLNELWCVEIQRRLDVDGLSARFDLIDNANGAMRGCGIEELFLLCRLTLQDGTLPPSWELEEEIEADQGLFLSRARERHPTPQPDRTKARPVSQPSSFRRFSDRAARTG
jgi:hypothetical protein